MLRIPRCGCSEVYAPLRSVLNGGPLDLQHPFFNVGDEFVLKRTPQQDDFYHLMDGKFCGEAWDAVSRYVYSALQGGSIMKGWTNDDRIMIACCNDGTRPVIFKIERKAVLQLTNMFLSGLKYPGSHLGDEYI